MVVVLLRPSTSTTTGKVHRPPLRVVNIVLHLKKKEPPKERECVCVSIVVLV